MFTVSLSINTVWFLQCCHHTQIYDLFELVLCVIKLTIEYPLKPCKELILIIYSFSSNFYDINYCTMAQHTTKHAHNYH